MKSLDKIIDDLKALPRNRLIALCAALIKMFIPEWPYSFTENSASSPEEHNLYKKLKGDNDANK